ncbi:hypothetical protein ALUC_61247A [Aspergillus luchuensis]|nr:hypothetical protein ALUC_61247A [Aspergillus luchuensis]
MTNPLAISLPKGHSSSDAGKPSRTRGLLQSAKRILSLFHPRRIFDHQQRSEDKVKMSNRQTNHELVVVGSQARLPMNGRGPTVNRRPQLHESNRNHDVRLYRPAMDDQNNHSDIPTISAAVSPGLSTQASTDQTTPLDPHTELRLPGDDEYIRATSLDRISQVNLSPVSTNSEYSEEVFMVGSNPTNKVSALMALDTQASANLMDVELQQELELMMEPCDQELVPLQTKTGKDRIKPFGIAKDVSWHFAQREKTFTSDFLVVDMKNYNAILGRKDIKKLEILKSGPGLERRTTIRMSRA